jgi:hypothetical protein
VCIVGSSVPQGANEYKPKKKPALLPAPAFETVE